MARFEDVFSDETKRGHKIQTSEYLSVGKYPIIDQGQAQIAGYTDLEDGLFTDVPAIIFGDHTRIIKYVDSPFFLGADGVKVLKTKVDGTDYKYLFYCLQNAKIPNTGYNRHFKWLKEVDIPLPPLKEQHRIAALLDKVSDLITKRRAQLDKLDLLVKAQFVEMFGEQYTNSKEWETGTIRDVVSEVKYGTSRPAVEGGAYKYLRMGNITFDGHLDLNNLKYIDIPESKIEKCIVKKGDVLFNRTNSKELVGKTCVFDIDEPMVIAGYIIRVRVNERVLPDYLSAVLNSQYGKRTLADMCKAIVGQANINAQELQSIAILIPPIELQRQFSQFVNQVNKLASNINCGVGKLETLKKALMQQYFG